MGVSQYLENARLNWLKGTAFPAAPATMYIALYTVAPSDSGGGTEVSGGAYARASIASTGWGAISGGGTSPEQISNSGVVSFPTPTASWGTVVAFAIFDAATGGNMLYWNTFTSSTTINAGASVSFGAGSLTVMED